MSMSQDHNVANDEIDLIELFGKLWDNKLTIFIGTVLCGCLGVFYLFATPGKYVGEFVLRGPSGAKLAAYVPLNDKIKQHYKEFLKSVGDIEVNQFELTADGLVDDMIRELQRYDAFEVGLKTHVPTIKDMSEDELSNARSGLFSSLAIEPATERDPEVKVRLGWSDEAQLQKILSETLKVAEKNLTAEKFGLLSDLADNIERRKQTGMKQIEIALLSAQETIDLATQSRLLLLKEQVELARTLDLAESRLIEGELGLSLSGVAQAGPEVQNSNALYLRGYKSLEKEIALIEARSQEQNYLLNQSYVALKRRAIELKNTDSAGQFRDIIEASPFATNASIFNIDEADIWTKNTRNGALTLLISLFLGFIASSLFVLLRGAFANRKPATTG